MTSAHINVPAKLSPAARDLLLVCSLFLALIAVIDLFTANLNLSILYALPVLVAAQSGRHHAAFRFTVAAVILTYAGYFFGPWPHNVEHTWRSMFLNYRILNRTLSVMVICAIAAISKFNLRFRASIQRKRGELDALDPEAKLYDELLRSFEQLTAIVISVLLIAGVAIVDLLTPAQFNLPILYAVPLVICAWTQRRAMLWSMLPILLFFTYLGFLVGPGPSDSSTSLRAAAATTTPASPGVVVGHTEFAFPSLLTNRTLAASLILGTALVMHWWIGVNQPKPPPHPVPATA